MGPVFYFMVLAHLLYDFHWQGDFIAQNKGRYFFILFIHALTWAMLLCAVLMYFDMFAEWKYVFLLTTHMAADSWKSKLPKTPDYFWGIYVDQGIHFATIVIVALL